MRLRHPASRKPTASRDATAHKSPISDSLSGGIDFSLGAPEPRRRRPKTMPDHSPKTQDINCLICQRAEESPRRPFHLAAKQSIKLAEKDLTRCLRFC